MFGKPIELFKVFGFTVRIDPSWFIVAILLTGSFATVVFPSQLPGRAPALYWLMGIAGGCGYFLSVVLHELSHSLVARTYGVEMRGITLFVFGGIAEMPGEVPTPQSELVIEAAGPAASFGIALAAGGLGFAGRGAGWPEAAATVQAWRLSQGSPYYYYERGTGKDNVPGSALRVQRRSGQIGTRGDRGRSWGFVSEVPPDITAEDFDALRLAVRKKVREIGG